MQADALDLDASVQETLERSAGADAQLSDIKALLGRMMFTGKSVHKKVRLAALGARKEPVFPEAAPLAVLPH